MESDAPIEGTTDSFQPTPSPQREGFSLDEPPLLPEESTEETFAYRCLDPKVRRLWWVENTITALIMIGVAIVIELVIAPRAEKWILPRWSVLAFVACCLTPILLLWPPLQYSKWRWALRRHDVVLSHGVLWQVHRSIPRKRVQHVDVRSGPLERVFGLVSLVLFTAGTGDADARIPGLREKDAESLRDMLLDHE